MGKKKKNRPGTLSSDADFLRAFDTETPVSQIPSLEISAPPDEPDDDETFATLLEAYLDPPASGFRKPGTDPLPYHRRIRRYPPPERELDLHGYTAIAAGIKTRSFVVNSRRQGYFTLRIIVGRGLHSDIGPVLPDVVEDILMALKQESVVLGFEWERRKKSRSGSLIVYLQQFSGF